MGTLLPGDDRHAFADALAALTGARVGDDLCAPFIGAVGVTGAAISTLGRPLGSETVCASDEMAARIDEIQIDLGEGPGWQALRTRRPVIESDLQRSHGTQWPLAREAVGRLDIGALFAFPLFVGDLGVGSVDLYCASPLRLSPRAVRDATVLAGVTSRLLLRRALDEMGDVEEGLSDGPHSRRVMHQASGMVAAQLGIAVDDALLVIRGRAFASGRSVSEVSADVVARRLAFES
ncbi:GAF domain-containing protein [Microbacterium sp. AG1240]|uniref:GAF and ANTAR domain-containing protein n=1 Tax=Microbacterium sp. AG1240 TaxID=2183992 RepID=UPI000EB0C1AE|nr:GAF and ANTAR domain-containing protein [Microbacterium sp. AG1240]RKT35772.1 GAF domain-containing protein [Microbacterium sp. AG1240]